MMQITKPAAFFIPGKREHRLLRNIAQGELTDSFDCRAYGFDPSDKSYWPQVEDLVQDEHDRWRDIHKHMTAYIYIEKCWLGEDAWVLQAFLTSEGRDALKALDNGLVWARDEKSIDLAKTAKFYDDDIERGSIERIKAENLMDLAQIYPELHETRARFVYLRMQGSLEAGTWRRPPVISNV